LDKNANNIWTYDPVAKESIEAVLYDGRDFQGTPLTLPGASGWGGSMNLGQFNWSDRAASIIVRWKGPKLALGPPALQKFETQLGINRPGGDYKALNVNDANLCEQACASEQQCKAFTWVKTTSGCWLKSNITKPVYDSGCVSGVNPQYWASLPTEYQKPYASLAFDTEAGIDRPGGGYKDFDTTGGPDLCQKTCGEDPKCKAYTWVKPGVQTNSAVCWLKSNVTKPVYNANCVSGIIAQLKASLPPDYQKPQAQQNTTFLATNNNPSTEGEAVTFTASVTGNAGTPTGTVSFKDGNTTLATIGLGPSGHATLTTTALSAGTHSITAVYSGSASFSSSASGALAQTVNQAATASTAVDLAGIWHSSIGIDYLITQSGGHFTWFVGLINETGQGTLSGQSLTVNWSGPLSKGSTTGKVTQVDPSGKATRIDWSNGAFFYR